MSIEQFRQRAGIWGAEPSRWPAADRELYGAFAATAQGREILNEQARLDAFLDALEPRPADPLRAARIVRAAGRAPLARRQVAWMSGAWAAAAVLGFMLGYMEPSAETDPLDDSYVQLLSGNTTLEELL